jgi:hypothetical protein
MSRLKRIVSSRWFLISASTYLALWLATYLIGAPQVRDMALKSEGVKPSWVEVARPPGDSQPPYKEGSITYFCEVVSYAPLVLTVRYGVTLSDEGGIGGTDLHFWLGRPSRRISLFSWAV